MSTTMKELGIDRMNPEDRLKLVQEIWDSLTSEAEQTPLEQTPLTEPQRADLQRRLANYESNPKAGSSWEEVKARLQERPTARIA
jgi:putative addiction module component (TIGR02574 family)